MRACTSSGERLVVREERQNVLSRATGYRIRDAADHLLRGDIPDDDRRFVQVPEKGGEPLAVAGENHASGEAPLGRAEVVDECSLAGIEEFDAVALAVER